MAEPEVTVVPEVEEEEVFVLPVPGSKRKNILGWIVYTVNCFAIAGFGLVAWTVKEEAGLLLIGILFFLLGLVGLIVLVQYWRERDSGPVLLMGQLTSARPQLGGGNDLVIEIEQSETYFISRDQAGAVRIGDLVELTYKPKTNRVIQWRRAGEAQLESPGAGQG